MRAIVLVALLSACGRPPDFVLSNGVSVFDNTGRKQPWPQILEAAFEEAMPVMIAHGIVGQKRADANLKDLNLTLFSDEFECYGLNSVGCTVWPDNEINISVVDTTGKDPCPVSVLGHELVHWSLSVSGKDPDSQHQDRRWFNMPDSAEMGARRAIKQFVCGVTP